MIPTALQSGTPVTDQTPARRLDLREFAFRFADTAESGDLSATSAILEQLFALRGRFPLLALLREIARGTRKLVFAGPFYELGAAQASETLRKDFADASAACSAFLSLPPPTILLECSAMLEGVHLTISAFPGLSLIRLSRAASGFPDKLRPAVFHETAHAFLTCGVRILDEGLACLIAGRFGGSAAPLSRAVPSFSLRTLLSSAASSGLFFEGAGVPFEQSEAIGQLGARVVDALHRRLGPRGLTGLFHELAKADSDQEVAQLIEQALGHSVERFDAVVSQLGANAALVDEAQQQVFLAYRTEQPVILDAVIERLMGASVQRDLTVLDALIGARIARAILRMNTGGSVASDEVACIDALIQEGKALPEGRLWTLRGHRAVLALKLAKGNFVKSAELNKKAVVAYARALALSPADPDALIGRALLFINTPTSHGGDREKGINSLRELTGDAVFGEHARTILERLGEAAADAASALQGGLTGEPTKEDDLAIRAKDLRLAPRGSAFTLEIEKLEVRRNEHVAFVGRNGSGKTVLLESLLGLRPGAGGTVELAIFPDLDPGPPDRNRRLGMSLQHVGLVNNVYVREIVRMHDMAYGRGSALVFDALGLAELSDQRCRSLSRGQAQRVQLYLALAHQPAVVLLDEPSLGLDETFATALRGLWRAWEMTLLVISHVPADVEAMDRVVVIENGQIADDGPVTALRDKYAGKYKMKVLQPISAQLADALCSLPGTIRPPELHNGSWTLHGDDTLAAHFRTWVEQNGLRSFSVELASTDDFLAYVTRRPTI
jgi:ABC-type multidrug transport system ATPase subunit